MIIRTSWAVDVNSSSDTYCTKEETRASVIENFDIRRLYSSEGYSVDIDGVQENVIIQDHSNPLNENRTDKKIHVSMDSMLTTGSYVIHNSETWLTVSHINIIDNAYKSAQILKCNYNLRFLSSSGQPTSRYCCVSSSTSSTDNTTGAVNIEYGIGKMSIKLPFDSNTSLLDRTYADTGENQRILVDFDSLTPLAYEIKSADRVSQNGIITLMVEECPRSDDDNVELMIAAYYSRYETAETVPTTASCQIGYSGSPIINVGKTYKRFSPIFYDATHTVITGAIPIWTISMVNSSLLVNVISENSGDDILVKVSNIIMVGETIKLELTNEVGDMNDSVFLGVTVIGR